MQQRVHKVTEKAGDVYVEMDLSDPVDSDDYAYDATCGARNVAGQSSNATQRRRHQLQPSVAAGSSVGGDGMWGGRPAGAAGRVVPQRSGHVLRPPAQAAASSSGLAGGRSGGANDAAAGPQPAANPVVTAAGPSSARNNGGSSALDVLAEAAAPEAAALASQAEPGGADDGDEDR